MDKIQQYLRECFEGKITVEELKVKLHFHIDDVLIPDVIYVMENKPSFSVSELLNKGE